MANDYILNLKRDKTSSNFYNPVDFGPSKSKPKRNVDSLLQGWGRQVSEGFEDSFTVAPCWSSFSQASALDTEQEYQ
jgi:hypothetical protein